MKVLLVDYGGYPFILQLGRQLAAAGHTVVYAYRDGGRLAEDALSRRPYGSNLRVVPLNPGMPMEKSNLLRRRAQEKRTGELGAERLRTERPDVLLSTNAPLEVQARLYREAGRQGTATVYWLQDLIGRATRTILAERLGLPGRIVGSLYGRLEARLLRQSDAVIAISDAFLTALDGIRVPRERLRVIPNWGPLDEIPELSKANPWAERQGLDDRPVVMYSGSLGMKHDPSLLLSLAQALHRERRAEVTVVAEGAGANWLREAAEAAHLDNLRVLPFQDAAVLPQVLATADVLVTILEPAAAAYSVPSKVLTYLCAGRPVVAAVPEHNDVARLLVDIDAGIVCSPGQPRALIDAVETVLDQPELRARLGRNGRRHAELTFDIERIAPQFDTVLQRVVSAPRGPESRPRDG